MDKIVILKIFEIAVKKGYCNIYSTSEHIKEALQKVIDEVIKI
jgi:hypothetical protein